MDIIGTVRNLTFEPMTRNLRRELTENFNQKEREMLEEKIMGKTKRAKKRNKKRQTEMKRKMLKAIDKGFTILPVEKKEDRPKINREESFLHFIEELNKATRDMEGAFNPLFALTSKVITTRKKEEKKPKIVLQYGNHIHIKPILKGTPESYLYTIYCNGKTVATVCLLRLFPNTYARGIAICGPTDKNITLSRGREIAARRAIFAFEERLNTCVIIRENRFIKIVSKEFNNKYKSQYKPILTVQEEKMIVQDDVRSMRYYSNEV